MLKIARGHESEFVIARDAGGKVQGLRGLARGRGVRVLSRAERQGSLGDASGQVLGIQRLVGRRHGLTGRIEHGRDALKVEVGGALCRAGLSDISLEQALTPSAEVISRAAVAAARVRRFITFLPDGP